MLQKVKYIEFIRNFSVRLNRIVKHIEKNSHELTDKDREVIEALYLACLKLDKNN